MSQIDVALMERELEGWRLEQGVLGLSMESAGLTEKRRAVSNTG